MRRIASDAILGHHDGSDVAQTAQDAADVRRRHGVRATRVRLYGEQAFSALRATRSRVCWRRVSRSTATFMKGYWRVLDTPADLAAGREELAQRGVG